MNLKKQKIGCRASVKVMCVGASMECVNKQGRFWSIHAPLARSTPHRPPLNWFVHSQTFRDVCEYSVIVHVMCTMRHTWIITIHDRCLHQRKYRFPKDLRIELAYSGNAVYKLRTPYVQVLAWVLGQMLTLLFFRTPPMISCLSFIG